MKKVSTAGTTPNNYRLCFRGRSLLMISTTSLTPIKNRTASTIKVIVELIAHRVSAAFARLLSAPHQEPGGFSSLTPSGAAGLVRV
jgi:hypothetical protein